ncbi:hypothetical protein D3C72_1553570 [compost metagenome]
MQVADGVGIPGAVGALVQAHGPATHPLRGVTDPIGGLAKLAGRYASDLLDVLGRVRIKEIRHRIPAVREFVDKGRVCLSVLVQQVQQSVQQGEIGAGANLQIEAGLVRRGVAARVHDDQLRPRFDPIHHAQEQDRVAVGHVRANHKEQVRAIKVLV